MAWASALHGVLYEMAAAVIRLAVERSIITKADLWRHGDKSFWQLLLSSTDPDVAAAARRVRPDVVITDLTPTPADMEPERGVFATSFDADSLCVLRPLKFRTIDPDVVVVAGVTKRLSELDEGYRRARATYIERKCGERRWVCSSSVSGSKRGLMRRAGSTYKYLRRPLTTLSLTDDLSLPPFAVDLHTCTIITFRVMRV